MNKIMLIAAIDNNNGIGYNNKLLCELPLDLKSFRNNTLGCNIIMGRKTFESLPNGALKQRKNIVLSNSTHKLKDCFVVNNINDALDTCDKNKDIFVIGGESVYKQFINIASYMIITHIDNKFECDAYFPEFNLNNWSAISSRCYVDNLYNCKRVVYSRKQK